MIISFGFLIILGKINWTNFLVLAISGGLIFGSGQIAVTFFMPKAIKVMENDGSFKTYTPVQGFRFFFSDHLMDETFGVTRFCFGSLPEIKNKVDYFCL